MRTFLISGLLVASSSVFAAGPTPVPSAPPNTPLRPSGAPVSVAEGRWVGHFSGGTTGDYVVFDVTDRHISDLRVSTADNECRYVDGRTLKFPFTLSRAARNGELTLIPIGRDGRAAVTAEVSDSGHTYRMTFTATLNGRTGSADFQGVSVGGRDSCTISDYFIPLENTGAIPAKIPQPCGYPWSPPDCSNSSPLTQPPVPAPTP